jgi:hypothetical protein
MVFAFLLKHNSSFCRIHQAFPTVEIFPKETSEIMSFLYIIFFPLTTFVAFLPKENGEAFGKNKLSFNFTSFANLLEN